MNGAASSAHGRPNRVAASRRVAVLAALAAFAAGGTVGLAIPAWYGATDPSSTGGAQTEPGRLRTQIERPEPVVEPVEPPVAEPEVFDLTAHSTTDPTSIWVVVNKQHPVEPRDFVPDDLVNVSGIRLKDEAAEATEEMLDAAADDGVTLLLRSGFRPYGDQAVIRANIEAKRGFDHAERFSARPGFSEHQTGLALDVGSASEPSCSLRLCFAETEEGLWLAEHAEEFGFLIRYDDAYTEITGFAGEPWHLRYVGIELVDYMAENNLVTLEEVFDVSGGSVYLED